MGGSGGCEAAGLCFDHGAENIASPGALLLQVETDGVELFARDGFIHI